MGIGVIRRAASVLAEERGAGLAEYAVLLLLVAMACITAITTLGSILVDAFTQISGMF